LGADRDFGEEGLEKDIVVLYTICIYGGTLWQRCEIYCLRRKEGEKGDSNSGGGNNKFFASSGEDAEVRPRLLVANQIEEI
jgi:hypothetical protein